MPSARSGGNAFDRCYSARTRSSKRRRLVWTRFPPGQLLNARSGACPTAPWPNPLPVGVLSFPRQALGSPARRGFGGQEALSRRARGPLARPEPLSCHDSATFRCPEALSCEEGTWLTLPEPLSCREGASFACPEASSCHDNASFQRRYLLSCHDNGSRRAKRRLTGAEGRSRTASVSIGGPGRSLPPVLMSDSAPKSGASTTVRKNPVSERAHPEEAPSLSAR